MKTSSNPYLVRYLTWWGLALFLLIAFAACKSEDPKPEKVYEVASYDGTVTCTFGELAYRVYYPVDYTGVTQVIHVSRGGTGAGDDRGQLLEYVEHYVARGFVVVQVDHRPAGSDIPTIARYRGEEIVCISGKVTEGELAINGFTGTIDPDNQGYAGHSGGCMEGLEAAGTEMTHGNYEVPEIKAVFGMSPAGYDPDQFGIATGDTPGYAAIGTTAVFLVLGEEEKNVNGTGTFMKTDWRLQAYAAMNGAGPRFQAYVQGAGTSHAEISGDNPNVLKFNLGNSIVFFDTYLRGASRTAEIGQQDLPGTTTGLEIILSKKGL